MDRELDPMRPFVVTLTEVIRLEEMAWWRGFFVGGAAIGVLVLIIYFFPT